MSDDLLFKVGQCVEVKSFLKGYRGAWFRAKIKQFGMRKYEGKDEKACALEYFDFPDEKIQWTKLYQKRSKYAEFQLVMRPCFPPVYRSDQLASVDKVTDVVVIQNDIWKVGDLADWWTDDCYWSGTITKALGNDKFQLELLPPPDGEGSTYEVLGKELRPSLDWSLEQGWTLPKENVNYQPCARLVKSLAEVNPLSQQNGSKETEEKPLVSNTSRGMQTQVKDVPADVTDGVNFRTSCYDNVLCTRAKSAEVAVNMGTSDSELEFRPTKIMRAAGSSSSNSIYSNAIETAIMDLEELAHRVKWMKSILDSGGRSSNPEWSKWQYSDHRAAPTSK